jgi:hypothetical protein
VRRDQQILSRTKNGKFGKTVVRRDQQMLSRTKKWKIWRDCYEERSINTFPHKEMENLDRLLLGEIKNTFPYKKWKIWKDCCEERSTNTFPNKRNGKCRKLG